MIWADFIAGGYVVVMALLGVYTHELNFLMVSVLGLMCFTAIVAMTKWCVNRKEVNEDWLTAEKSKEDDSD